MLTDRQYRWVRILSLTPEIHILEKLNAGHFHSFVTANLHKDTEYIIPGGVDEVMAYSGKSWCRSFFLYFALARVVIVTLLKIMANVRFSAGFFVSMCFLKTQKPRPNTDYIVFIKNFSWGVELNDQFNPFLANVDSILRRYFRKKIYILSKYDWGHPLF